MTSILLSLFLNRQGAISLVEAARNQQFKWFVCQYVYKPQTAMVPFRTTAVILLSPYIRFLVIIALYLYLLSLIISLFLDTNLLIYIINIASTDIVIKPNCFLLSVIAGEPLICCTLYLLASNNRIRISYFHII